MRQTDPLVLDKRCPVVDAALHGGRRDSRQADRNGFPLRVAAPGDRSRQNRILLAGRPFRLHPPSRSCGESFPRWPIAGTSSSLARQPVGVWTERVTEDTISKCGGQQVPPQQRRRHNGGVLAIPAMPRSARSTSSPASPTDSGAPCGKIDNCPSSERRGGIDPASILAVDFLFGDVETTAVPIVVDQA